jgi:hypothetical protein
MTMVRFLAPSAVTLAFLASSAVAREARAADPTTAQCLAAADQSIQLRDQHQLRAARAQMLVCAATSCPAAVQSECLRRVDQINAAIPTVVFEPKDASGNDLSNVSVEIDGQPLAPRLDGTALPLDPGVHRFRFVPEGGSPVEKTIVIHEGEKDRHERIDLGGGAAPIGTATRAPGAQAASASIAPPSEGDPGASRRLLAYIVGGAGVAGLAVGTIFGVMASSDSSNSKNECSSVPCAGYTKSLNDYNSASTEATVSTIAFVAGGAAVAAGAVLFFTAPKASSGSGTLWQVSPAVGSSGIGVSLKGSL